MNTPVSHDHAGEPVAPARVRTKPGVLCIKCLYALEGLPADGVCPECGTPVSETLRWNLLSEADLGYIGTLIRGLSVTLYGLCAWLVVVIAVMVVGTIGQVYMIPSTPGGTISFPPWLLPAQIIGAVVSLITVEIVLLGYWRFAGREPDPTPESVLTPERSSAPGPGSAPAPSRDPASRLVLRWATGVHAIAAVFATASGIASTIWTQDMLAQLSQTTPGAGTVPTLSPGFWVASIVGSLAGLATYAAIGTAFFSSMFYIRALALRVPDLKIHRKAKARMIACPIWATVGIVLLGIGPLVALVLYWNLLNMLKGRLVQIRRIRMQHEPESQHEQSLV